ncbi:MAG: amidohydrolase family protein [Ignavibacteriales bacterium]|nr:amidohydrolase family protein [Ignavibacteriales bacterium]
MKTLLVVALITFVYVVANGQHSLTKHSSSAVNSPLADHHQHLFSPAIVDSLFKGSATIKPILARDIIGLLDSAGIQRAVLLSVAYLYGRPSRNIQEEYTKVKAENDWTGAQAALYPDRLSAFCSVNPLKEYALEEIDRCAKDQRLRSGIKLHFGNSDVQLDSAEHVEQLRRVFRKANEHRMAIVAHMRPSISKGRPYGAQQARIFLEQILTVAPHITVQIAHLAGTGPGYNDPPADSALAVFIQAIINKDERTKNLWFDITTVVEPSISAGTAALLASRIRQIGASRVLYGSDAAVGDNLRPRQSWAAFLRLPLTEEEFKTIASNLAPYLLRKR